MIQHVDTSQYFVASSTWKCIKRCRMSVWRSLSWLLGYLAARLELGYIWTGAGGESRWSGVEERASRAGWPGPRPGSRLCWSRRRLTSLFDAIDTRNCGTDITQSQSRRRHSGAIVVQWIVDWRNGRLSRLCPSCVPQRRVLETITDTQCRTLSRADWLMSDWWRHDDLPSSLY